MAEQDNALSSILRRSIIRFWITQAVTLVVFTGFAIVYTAYYNARLAEQLAAAFRPSILSGDTRQIMYDMSDSVTKNFSSMQWRPASGQGAFSIPAGATRANPYIFAFAAASLFYDENNLVAAGELRFYYNRWSPIGLACVLWAITFAFFLFMLKSERRRIAHNYNIALEFEVKESQFAMAAQVAHDIRSPVYALDAALKNMTQLPEQQRVIVRHAVNRIRDVANGLLEKNRQQDGAAGLSSTAGQISDEPSGIYLLSSLIDPVVTEKRLQYGTKPGISLDFELTTESYGLFANIQPAEFRRIISNLVNNAAEALGDKGAIRIALSKAGDSLAVSVSDNGKGIPQEILAKLGRRGETHGKAGGSGLGLYHARTSVENCGGSLDITSATGKGTTVTLKFPKAKAPDYFIGTLTLKPDSPVLVLDDDPGIHQIWRGRLESARTKERGIEAVYFSDPEQLRAWVRANPAKVATATCLFDYELSGRKETGISLAEELGLCSRTVLVTSHSEEPRIINDCIRLKLKLIPKGLSGYVPIAIKAPEPTLAVLLDDDALTHMTWEMAAQERGIELKAFTNPDDFRASLGDLQKNTPLYIDSDLGENIKGEEIAAELRKKGFTDICLATAHSPEKFAHLPWLKVITKAPPWA